MDQITRYLRSSGDESRQTAAVAMGLFKEGQKNHSWRDPQNQPITSCLIHASGFYGVSLELNRAIGNKQGIAHNLSNLGDVRRLLGDRDGALAYWHEAMTRFTELGDQEVIKLLNQWIGEVKDVERA